MRNTDPSRWFDFAEYSGLFRVSGRVERGDVLLVKAAPGQQHLLIAEHPATAIHAHAGLRRVVRETIVFPNMPIAHWRLQP